MLSPTTLLFVNFVALKTQFTSKWTGTDTVKGNFPTVEAQFVRAIIIILRNLSGPGYEK